MSKPTIGQLIDAEFRVRTKRLAIEAEAKKLKQKQDEIELMLMDALDAQKTRKGEGTLASASISESIEPVAEDWEQTDRFILRHKEIQLLQRRIKVERFRELLAERPKGIPGLGVFTKRKVNLRKLSK